MKAKDKKDKGSNQGLVPKLRFPEFQDDINWQKVKIGKHLVESRVKGNRGDVAKKITVKLWGNGVHEKQETLKGSANTQYFRRKAGQFIYSKLDFLNQAFGIIPDYLNDFESTVDLPCFDVSEELDAKFLLEYVQRKDFYKKFGEIADGGRKAKRIQVDTFLSFSVFLPSRLEQQKIADCLSSLDELIAAQAHKLDTLKAHKKGLMQQLFPAPGQTTPTLRFPEFRNAGEWKETALGQLGKIVSGLTYRPDDIREEGLLVLRSSNIQNGLISLEDSVYVTPKIKGANPTKPNDILICVRNGSKSLIGKNALIPEEMPSCTHGAFMTILRAKSAKFIFQLFQTEIYKRHVEADLGATINSINSTQLKKYALFIPKPDEQQKIADCLSSLDELIAAQAQKLDTLKAHKKGLMQQLFPNPDEANG